MLKANTSQNGAYLQLQPLATTCERLTIYRAICTVYVICRLSCRLIEML